jgi:Lrp/AsnC family leucine-responsive transcriptional regulator
MLMLDAIDRQILRLLQKDARMPNSEIAKQVGIVPSATSERIRKLLDKGIITGYDARLNPQVLEHNLVAFVYVRTDEPVDTRHTGEALASIPEVQEVHNIAGEDCYLVKVRVKDTEMLGRFLREKIGAIKSVRNTRTTIALETFKESLNVPVDDPK